MARHPDAVEWASRNDHAHFHNRCGQFYYGMYAVQGQQHLPPVETNDLHSLGVRARQAAGLLLQSFGRITSVISAAQGALAPDQRQEMEKLLEQFEPSEIHDVSTIARELFHLWVIVVNAPSGPHYDSRDWKHGLTWTAALGNFRGGDYFCREMNRRVPVPPGTIVGMVSSQIQHHVQSWYGSEEGVLPERYAIVHVFHNYFRTEAVRCTMIDS